jgi:glycolate oxidase iron-sulfur subunit
MADMRELVRMMNELDEDMVQCVRCGLCQAACPLYAETGRETDVARGKLVILENLSKEILKDPKAAKERLDKCLLCGSCAAACPSGVKIMDVFLKARAIITGYLGLSPVKKAIFRGFLSDPDRFDRLLRWVARFQGPFSRKIDDTLGSSCARFMSPVVGDRHYMSMSKSAWHKTAGRGFQSPKGERLRVAFYPGCLTDKVLPRIADAAMKVFDHHGVDVFVPHQLPCCGIPALAAGDLQTFEALIQKNLALFGPQDFDFLVTPCATCTSTMKEIWPLMIDRLPEDVQEGVRVLSDKTRDINQFLVDAINVSAVVEPAETAPSLTYHDPCHLRKSLSIISQPRTVIRAAGTRRFLEMAEPERCCGMGGSFNLQHYDLSKKIGEKKLERIKASGAEAVATGCPACMMQITDLLSHAGRSIPVRHTVEIYAEAIEKTTKP